MAAQRRTHGNKSSCNRKYTLLRTGVHAYVDCGAVKFNSAEIQLVREPNNEHDANAIAIWWNGVCGQQLLGYVNRNQAVRVARCLDHGGRVIIDGHRIYGRDKENYGMYLHAKVLFWKDLKAAQNGT